NKTKTYGRTVLMSSNIQKGKEGEQFVANYLLKQGYRIIHQNFRHKYGEVDIIAKKDEVVAFVEVKWRKNPLIDPAEIINSAKQKKIISVAKLFLTHHTNEDIVCRFDVALVEEHNHSLQLRYISNAFSAFE